MAVKARLKYWAGAVVWLCTGLGAPAQAQELLRSVTGGDHAAIMGEAVSVRLTDDGIVYVSTQSQGTLLRIGDTRTEAFRLWPTVFADSDLGGVDLLADGSLVVVNEGSGQVGILDYAIEPRTLFARSGGEAGELRRPGPVAASVNGLIYVGDVRNRRISVFNDQGLYLHSIGRTGDRARDLEGIEQIAIDADENVYVLEGPTRLSVFDRNSRLVARFDADALREVFGNTPEFSAMASDLAGILYLGDRSSSRISEFDWRARKIRNQFGALGQSRTQYLDITALSVNNRGQLAILDRKNAKVEIFQLDAETYRSPRLVDRIEYGGAIGENCAAVYAFDRDRVLCLRRDTGGIFLLSADGTEQRRFAETAANPAAIHVGEYTVAVIDGNVLRVYGRDGGELFAIGRYGTAPGGFIDPGDVFVHDGHYYVSDFGNNRVQVFSGDGQFVEEIRAEQDGQRLFDKVGPIAVDAEANLYVADRGANRVIHVIGRSRKRIGQIDGGDGSLHRFDRLYALDIDRQGRLYVLAGSKVNDFWVGIYRGLELYRKFGAGGDGGTLAAFADASSLSVFSGAINRVYVNDRERGTGHRFELFEYPDAAFGLNIAANRRTIGLAWSSSKSPLIDYYQVEAARERDGEFVRVAHSANLELTLDNDDWGDYSWFRVVSVSARGLYAPASTPKENLFKIIAGNFERGAYGDAVRLADRLLRIDPDNADARELLAISLYRLEDYTRAITEFKRLETVAAYHDQALRYQVQAYYQLGQLLDARMLADRLIDTEPPDAEPYLVCARLSLDLADSIGAVGCAEEGLDRHPDHADLRYLLGRAYIEAGIAEDGLKAFTRVIESHPGRDDLRLRIADDLYRLGNYEAALAQYDALDDSAESPGVAAVGKARALLRLDRDDEAKAIAVTLSGNRATRGDGYYLLGKIALRQERYKEAVLRLTRAGRDSPGLIDNWLSLAQAYAEINQPGEAIEALEQGIERNPEAFELHLLAGRIELQRERYPEANAHLDVAVALNPQSLPARILYSRGLFATRNYRSAAIHADAAARIAPREIDVLVLQADIANQQGKTGSAIEYLKTAISLEPASPDLKYRIGLVYQDANLFDQAQSQFDQAAAIRPDWDLPLVALGNLYRERRRFDDAVAAFEQAVERKPSEANRALLNLAFAERKKSLEFASNAPQLLLSDLNLQRVFSAAYKQYQDKPIGSIKLQNISATDYGNLMLSFQIREFMDFPTQVPVPTIKGGETLEIPITATFNNRILEVDEDTGVQVEARLSFQRDGQKDAISLTQPMTIYGKNAIVWEEAQMVGSFVTPKDDTLRDFVRQIINRYQPDPGPLNDKLVAAMAFFSSLTAAGINYIVDPNTPFTELRADQIDYVQFPRETLRLKSGDCDDLSVLISAGLENLGIHTALIEVPGHLFLMFDTGLEAADAGLISQDPSLLALRDGRVWIPLEATMINTSFNEAWAEGARKYQRALAAGELGIIDLERAWQQYKPVTLQKAGYTIELPEPRRTESLVRLARKRLLARSIDRLVLPFVAMVANDPDNVAARLQIAILYSRYGLYEDAEIAFEALKELAPDDSAVKTNLGNLYFLQQNYSGAIEQYRQATELDTGDGGIWINLAMAQYRVGDLEKARNSYIKAVQLDATLRDRYDAFSKLLSQ